MTRRRKRTMLVDGDILAYMISTQCEVPVNWQDDLWTLHSDFNEVKSKFEILVSSYQEILLANNVVFTFTDKKNFRKKILPTYKFKRKNKRKPVTYEALKEYVTKTYDTFTFPWLEGDDCLGLLATSGMISGDKVILTKDKDLRTIPSTIWFMQGNNYEEITEKDADYNHMLQTISGDVADGYSGVPKCGIKTAQKILADVKHDPVAMWHKVLETFKNAKLSEKEALVQAQVARICRASDYDMKTNTPILWRQPL